MLLRETNGSYETDLHANMKTNRLYKDRLFRMLFGAVVNCINDGILAEFLEKNREEVLHVCLTEYNEKEFVESIREEGREEGAIGSFVTAIKGIMKKLHINADDAIAAVDVPPEYIRAVKALL